MTSTRTIMATVLRNRYARAWPGHVEAERGYVVSLDRALTRTYRSDAHLTLYTSPNGRRLSSATVDCDLDVALGLVCFDVDCLDVHGTAEPAPARWRGEMREKIAALLSAHPGAFYYETRGGARIVYALQTPTILRSREDAARWRRTYLTTLAYLERRFSIVADGACADWTRLFRLPRATREGGSGGPENWPNIGDVRRISALTVKPTEADSLRAAECWPRAFGRQPGKLRSGAPLTQARSGVTLSDGAGLLYHLLRARGAILGHHRSGAYVVRCPREGLHSCGRSGDGSTLLYPPAAGGEIGAIHCLHGHCSGLTVGKWLREFSDAELEEARRAAGGRSVAWVA